METFRRFRTAIFFITMISYYGLIGYPLGHSFSKAFFSEKFKEENIDAEYENFELDDITKLPALMLNHPELKGLNVTIPYKEAVIPYLDNITRDAKEIGAVNVITLRRNGEKQISLTGHNTDWRGFSEAIRPLLVGSNHRKALVLGSGGASKAVSYALSKLGITATIVSRRNEEDKIAYSDITPRLMEENTVIVNTTPLGMTPDTDSCPPIPYSLVTRRHIAFDLVYNPLTTKFMTLCRQQGAKVSNGLAMLHQQAILSWEIWTSNE